jgi:two-component system cell cycle sensor histidine kinase/response regulator CckA
VRAVLDSCVNMAAAELRHRARLIRDYRDVPLVDASESRIAQVFLNLLVNAAQAVDPTRASENEIRLVVTASGPSVVIDVIDNGGGIGDDLRARLFDPFVTTKPAGEGTGLGLFISREILHGLGGSIDVESELGRGTRMRVTVPAAAAVTVSSTPPRRSPLPDEPRARVLVIDDEDSIGLSLRRALEGEASVVVATSGLEALALLEADPSFDVILCDVVMPDVDGVAVFERARGLDPALGERFVFMTGGVLSPDTHAFLATMHNRLLEKPFSIDQLRPLLRRRGVP